LIWHKLVIIIEKCNYYLQIIIEKCRSMLQIIIEKCRKKWFNLLVNAVDKQLTKFIS